MKLLFDLLRKQSPKPLFETLRIGTYIYFNNDVKPYAVMLHNTRYYICVKRLGRAYTWCILDAVTKTRHTNEIAFIKYNFMHAFDREEVLERLMKGDILLSEKNKTPLQITKVTNKA